MSESTDKRRLSALRNVDDVLRPLGFKKSGPNWRRVTRLLNKHVLPCFDLSDTEKMIQRMMGDRSEANRAQSYLGLPETWWAEKV